MVKYIDVEKLKAEIERLYDGEAPKHDQQCDFDDGYFTGIGAMSKFIDSLQQEQPDTCIFGNIPSEEACKFCGVDCELREPKQSGITSTNLSSTNEAVGLAIMAYLDTKVKHDNAKVCGVSLKVAREWIREKIANKQEQPEVDLEKLGGIARHLIAVKDHEEDMRLNEGEWLLLERIGYHERFNARKEENK